MKVILLKDIKNVGKKGEVIDAKPVKKNISTSEIDQMMTSFLGEITQIPPMYSAVKVNGRKLYEYARAGETVERPSRKAMIYSFERISEPTYNDSNHTISWKFVVECGKGTYIRTLAVDLGSSLGYPAHMSQLTRIKSGPFEKKDCYTLEQVQDMKDHHKIDDILHSIDILFDSYPSFNLNENLWSRIKDGAVVESTAFTGHENTPLLALYYCGKLVALYKNHTEREGFKKPRKMFLP